MHNFAHTFITTWTHFPRYLRRHVVNSSNRPLASPPGLWIVNCPGRRWRRETRIWWRDREHSSLSVALGYDKLTQLSLWSWPIEVLSVCSNTARLAVWHNKVAPELLSVGGNNIARPEIRSLAIKLIEWTDPLTTQDGLTWTSFLVTHLT